MVTYNDVILPRLAEYIKYLLSRVTTSDYKEREITLNNYRVLDDSKLDINSYVKDKLTYSFDIQYNYTVSGIETVDGNPKPYAKNDSFELKVPKMINNGFIILGATRLPVTVLGKDYECKVYESNLSFDYYRNVSYDKDEDTGSVRFYVTVKDEDGNIEFEGTPENFETNAQFLVLSDYQRKKLQVKLDCDDSEIPESITYDLCMRLINLPSDRYNDSILEKRFITTEFSLIHELKSAETRAKILRGLRKKFYQSGLIYPLDIQNAIDRFFKVASDAELEIPPTINPLVFDSLKYKIIMNRSVAYNQTMADIIDVANTPANNNASRLNELNKCAKLKDDEIWIECYEYPSFNKVEIPYIDYLVSKVLCNTEVDYDKREVLPKKKYDIKLRLKRVKVNNLDGIQYIEPKPDDMLSLTSRQVPMLNVSDSVRDMMGTAMSLKLGPLQSDLYRINSLIAGMPNRLISSQARIV